MALPALPLLALGGAAARAGLGAIARTTGAVAARAGGAMRAGAAGGVGGGAAAIGFSDVVKTGAEQSPANNVVNFKAANNAVGRAGRSSGGAAAPITPTVASTSSMSGDIAAASELSMEELANQTQILKAIQKNTGVTAKNTMAPPSAGGQAAPPPTEEEIKGKLDDDEGSKLAKLVGKLEKGLSSSLGTAILALGAALAVNAPEDKKAKTRSDREIERLTGGGKDLEGIAGVLQNKEGAAAMAKFSEIDRYRFKNDGTVGEAEQEANKEKKSQIMAMIGEGGDPADAQKLETAFREGKVEDIQAIEDKYRQAGQEGSAAYQYRAADTKKFEFTAAMQVAKREGIETPGLLASDEERQKFRDDMLAKQNEFAAKYSKVVAGEGKNFDRREALLGDTNLIGAGGGRLDDVIMSQFDEEKRGSFFGRSEEEGKAFDNIKAELEGYRKSLKSSGLGEREVNNKIADEIKKLEGMSANQMLEYTAPPKISGERLEGVQTTASNEAAAATARTASRSAPASAPAPQQQQGTQESIGTNISVDNRAHDDTAKVLKNMNNIRSLSAM
jgi:hypothetical protein